MLNRVFLVTENQSAFFNLSISFLPEWAMPQSSMTITVSFFRNTVFSENTKQNLVSENRAEFFNRYIIYKY
ncbi:MAG: hypothetical protein Crog4KO_01740 [Crocinitomicaceae bacterium]